MNNRRLPWRACTLDVRSGKGARAIDIPYVRGRTEKKKMLLRVRHNKKKAQTFCYRYNTLRKCRTHWIGLTTRFSRRARSAANVTDTSVDDMPRCARLNGPRTHFPGVHDLVNQKRCTPLKIFWKHFNRVIGVRNIFHKPNARSFALGRIGGECHSDLDLPPWRNPGIFGCSNFNCA